MSVWESVAKCEQMVTARNYNNTTATPPQSKTHLCKRRAARSKYVLGMVWVRLSFASVKSIW